MCTQQRNDTVDDKLFVCVTVSKAISFMSVVALCAAPTTVVFGVESDFRMWQCFLMTIL